MERHFLQLLGFGGAVLASRLSGWGFPDASSQGASTIANPDSALALEEAITLVPTSAVTPDFILFAGDLTDTTGDITLRIDRFAEFGQWVSVPKTNGFYCVWGEHDAPLDGVGDAATLRQVHKVGSDFVRAKFGLR